MISCRLCGREFKTPKGLNWHLNNIHQKKDQGNSPVPMRSYSPPEFDEATKRVAAQIAAMTQEENDYWNERNHRVMDWLSR